MTEDHVTAGDALVAIADLEPSALKLVGDIMDYNARCAKYTWEQLFLGEQNAHEQTKQRLAEANQRIWRMESRILWLMGHDFEEEM